MPHPLAPILIILGLGFAGCSSVPPVGDPTNRLDTSAAVPDRINWPEQYVPEKATFYIQNAIEIAAPPEVVWDILVRAEAWPGWYPGAENVDVPGSDTGTLSSNARFTWRTMGEDLESVITEYQPPYRLSWEARKASIKGYHAWLIIPTETGCRVVTEETQFGFLATMQKWFQPNTLRNLHDVWLAELKRLAESHDPESGSL